MTEDELFALYASTTSSFRDSEGNGRMLQPRPMGITGTWPWPGEAVVWVITAENPESKELQNATNDVRMAALDAQLDALGVEVTPCVGIGEIDPETGVAHQENSRLLRNVAGPEIREIARHFGQNAIFRWTSESFDVVGVLINRWLPGGWALTKRAEP
jgi:hypothetical protein